MPIATAPKVQQISEAKDPKKGILEAVGDLSGVEVTWDWVLVGTYITPSKTSGGVFLPGKTVGEDEFQGNCGLILKMGPMAFKYEDYAGPDFKEGDWVVFGVGDAPPLPIRGAPCRLVRDNRIRARVSDPRIVRTT